MDVLKWNIIKVNIILYIRELKRNCDAHINIYKNI